VYAANVPARKSSGAAIATLPLPVCHCICLCQNGRDLSLSKSDNQAAGITFYSTSPAALKLFSLGLMLEKRKRKIERDRLESRMEQKVF
jgi:hypothetical protein